MKRGIFGLFGAMAIVGTVNAQTEELYIVDGGSGRISVVQGGAVVRSWNQPNTAMPVTVMSTVRTYVQYSTSGNGSEYLLDGTPTGTTYAYQGESNTGQNIDGGTDGEYNYLAAWNNGNIWRYDTDWKNPEVLFPVSGPTGVTYDSANGTLWVISYTNQNVTEYDMSGNVISSFPYSTSSNWMGCLAYEASTDTLWATDFSNGDLYQFSKSGAVLQMIAVPAIAGYAWGGEFAFDSGPPTPRCIYQVSKVKNKADACGRVCDVCPYVRGDLVCTTECGSANDCASRLRGFNACANGGACKVSADLVGCDAPPQNCKRCR